MKTTEQKVIKFINRENLISSGEKLLIALSGGPDSVFALKFFHKFSRLFNIQLSAFHLNHMLRGKDADNDEQFCRELCDRLKIELIVKRADVKKFSKLNKLSIEEGARKIRYSELESCAKVMNANKIVTAHNKNDNTETVLLNLIKGSGLNGITGIPVKRGNIIRPLLVLTSEEIREYLSLNKIECRIDSTNFESDYQRNFLRNEILPSLRDRINPAVDDAIFRNSFVMSQLYRFLERHISGLWGKVFEIDKKCVRIKYNLLTEDEKNLFGALLRKLFEEHLRIPFSYNDLQKMSELIDSKTGTTIVLAEDFRAIKEKESLIVFRHVQEETQREYKLKIGDSIFFDDVEIGIEEAASYIKTVNNDKKCEYIALDDMENEFIIRKWKQGDSFIPFGKKSKKNLSEFLVDEKVGGKRKKEQLVVENRNNIVWVVGLRLDNRYRIKNETKRIGKLWMK